MNNLKSLVITAVAVFAVTLMACNPQEADLENYEYQIDLENDQERFAYAMGVGYAKYLKQNGLDSISKKAFVAAMNDILKGKDQLLTDQECQTAIQTEYTKIEEQRKAAAIEEGKKFLEENASKPGVKVTDSGLQYEVLEEGDGPVPTASDRVKVHYTGMLTDGTVFDSSVERGQPAEFGVSQVIKGWTEALQMMPVGSKYKLVIPQDIAYGSQAPGQIKPYSTLIFEVELLEIL